jgi:CHAT domain-containing protein/cytochrome c-type biogenesis protein CcmH/NrfG
VLTPGDQHLTEDQLDRLAETSRSNDPAVLQTVGLDQAPAGHFSACPDCRRRLDGRIEANRKLALLRPPTLGDRGELCPSDEELMDVAAGIAEKEASQRMLDHAASCDHCGPRLQDLVREFSDPSSPEEMQIVASLNSNSSTWQNRMAARLSASSGRQKRKTRAWLLSASWKWPVLGCAAAALAAVFVWVLLPGPDRRVERLIGEAYTERRSLEPRISGAEFGPLRIQRAQQTSHMDSPSSLLEAEKEITSNLAKHPSDPFWLQSRARAELLEGNYNGAVDNLRQALAAKADSPSLLIDLATAYSQRADATGNTEDLGTAVDLLGQALKTSPRDPVALFNRAVISRKALLFSQAIEDWKTYLEVDPTSKWADEARTRMEEAQQEQEKRKHSGVSPLFTPPQFAALNFDDPATIDTVDQRLEAYDTSAIMDWLPVAYPTTPSDSSESVAARTALSKLARISLDQHSDHWWVDLLKQSSAPSFPLALKYLSSAITANESGATEIAHSSAALAIHHFRAAGGNEAGILRARLEDLYASNLAQDADKCFLLLRPLQDAAQMRSYRWLAVETRIQHGNCLWLREDLGGALAAYSSAASQAKDNGYGTISLAAQDHWSMAAGASGDYTSAWRLATEGLKQFWDGDFADVRGYNFYYSLYETARLRRQAYLQVSIWKDAIPLTESSQDLAQVAVAHTLSANSSLATNDSLQALHEFDQASQLFARSPQVEATRLAHLESETRLAGVELSLGQNQKALSRLRSMKSQVTQLSDNYLKVLFYENYGNALVSDGNITEGETATRSALQLAELQLRSVHDSNSRIEWKLNASGPCRDLVSLIFRKGNVVEALELWEAFKAAPATAGNDAQQVSVLSKAMSESDSRQLTSRLEELSKVTVISYALLPKELLIWVFDNRGVSSRHVDIPAAELSAAAAGFRELCSNPRSNLELVRTKAKYLYDRLIGPVESNLQPNRALIIELDEGLSGLPMEALLDANSHYLGERVPVISSFGLLYELQTIPEPRIGRDTTALVVAVSSPHGKLENPVPSLPDVIAEGQAVANRFVSAQLLTDENATLHETMERMPDSELFHFAGHASNSYTKPGLLLSDTTLTANSLEKFKVSRTRLVVLSACETEAGALGNVEAADSLVGYFVRAGVPRVVASRWSVDSGLTRQFMNVFYTHLLAGSSVEESIFQAQNAVRGQSANAHPFYWAAFTVFGSGIT